MISSFGRAVREEAIPKLKGRWFDSIITDMDDKPYELNHWQRQAVKQARTILCNVQSTINATTSIYGVLNDIIEMLEELLGIQ